MIDNKEKKWTDAQVLELMDMTRHDIQHHIPWYGPQMLQQYKESKQKYSSEQDKAVDMIKKWEYQWVPSKDTDMLNVMGKNGWEAYAVTEDLKYDSVRVWMKRELPQPSVGIEETGKS